ncbi:MAG: PAS domain S-box protein [Planctomycetaceae bacterium]|nr:PAS domain S-box protein [Planctomycetaceae bacterium]
MAQQSLRVVHASAEALQRAAVRCLLSEATGAGQIVIAATPEALQQALADAPTDALLLDFHPGTSRFPDLAEVLPVAATAGVPLVLLVAPELEAAASEWLGRGVADYILNTPRQLLRLPHTLRLVSQAAAAQRRATMPRSPAGTPAAPIDPSADSDFSVLNTLSLAVAVIDRRGNAVFINQAWRGFSRSPRHSPFALLQGDDSKQWVETLARSGTYPGLDIATVQTIVAGVGEILAGKRQLFSIEFRLENNADAHWYRMEAALLMHGGEPHVVLSGAEVTARVTATSTVYLQHQLLANIHDAVCATDTHGTITAWNTAAEQLYGWRAEDAIGRRIAEVVPTTRAADSWEILFREALASQPDRRELRHRKRDGQTISVAVVAVPLSDAKGNTSGYVVTIRDMTDRALAEMASWENEARWQLAGRAANEAICDLNLRTGIVWRSEGYHRLFGHAEEDLHAGLGWWLNKIHPEDVDRVWQQSAGLFAGSREFSAEYRFRRADGSYAYVLHRAFLLKSAEGDPLRIIGTLIDITERKRTEQILATSEQRYRLLAENSTDLISRIDWQGDFQYASPAVKVLMGYSPDELLGSNVYDYVHPDDLEETRRQIDAGTRTPRTLVFRALHKAGHYVWCESTIRTMQDPSNPDARETVCVTRDVTSRKEVEDLLRLQQAELAHISRLTSMGEMASGIAHELNQPLTTISHYADACQVTLGQGEVPVDRLLAWAGKIAEQAQRAGDIIRRIKGFVQKTAPERHDLDVNALLAEVIELIDPDARLHDIELCFEPGDSLPAVSADKVQIQQVLVNLLRNAFESLAASRAADRTVVVRVTAPDPHEVAISVEDRGQGIAADAFDRLFEPFFTTKPDGTGVGLPISRSIVEDHGGRIWATRNAERGMTFWFTLPTPHGIRHDGPQTDRVRRRRRPRSARSAAPHAGDDGL